MRALRGCLRETLKGFPRSLLGLRKEVVAPLCVIVIRASLTTARLHYTTHFLWGLGSQEKEKTPAKRGFMRAAGPGFEPGLTDPESVVLPLHHPAKGNARGILTPGGPGVELLARCSRDAAGFEGA